MNKRHIRIHGDNIVECERTLAMIHDALGGDLCLQNCPVYMPIYELTTEDAIFIIELLSGHGRWGVDIGGFIVANGGILREGADSYICEVRNQKEIFLLAIEYCSALPAGNNAWQRNGRALSSVLAGVPYLYMAELGGVELDEDREVKAARYPNPVVPFSYLCTTKDYRRLCVPVYKPHPSITDELYRRFEDVFGYRECLDVLGGIIMGNYVNACVSKLVRKTLLLVEILSHDKRENLTLHGREWIDVLKCDNRVSSFVNNSNLTWRKKTSAKVKATDRIKELITKAKEMSLNTIGASDIPISLIAQDRIDEFEELLRSLYPHLEITLHKDKPLAVVWITGYKPKGDDSRPDRGLCPLAKMVTGGSCRIISIVYGPAKPRTWIKLDEGIDVLAADNGLWQSIYKICDGVLIDSVTKNNPEYIDINQQEPVPNRKLVIPYISHYNIEHSEHDIDTAIHQILTKSGLTECLCNPPGGDWSGINYHRQGDIYRWTSLPRVSQIGGKRPDHVFQFESGNRNLFISIESKGKGSDLEDKIGVSLVSYLQDLFSSPPTSIKQCDGEWRLYNNEAYLGVYEIISAGAFIYKNDMELQRHLDRGELDCVMAFEFGESTVVHILSNVRGRLLEDFVKQASARLGGFEIKIH